MDNAKTSPTVIQPTPSDLITQAISSGADLEKLEKLLSLQERWESNEAKKAYHQAMTAFKANPPEIEKDRSVAYGATKYKHATLSNATKKINKALSEHGLSASWTVKQDNGLISVTCKITHVKGYGEEATISGPSDNSGGKNAIQSIGSAIAYLERYSLFAITGLAAHDIDDDARGVSELITADEAKVILDQLLAYSLPVDSFLKYMNLEKIEAMPRSDLKKAQVAIDKKKAAKVPAK